MIKNLTEEEYENLKKEIRNGGQQGKVHYSVMREMLDREDERKQALLDHINYLHATCKTHENMIDHYRRVVRSWREREINDVVEHEFKAIDDLFNITGHAN
jgi:coenzyme F420-reducing hydrogenase alpha subunit